MPHAALTADEIVQRAREIYERSIREKAEPEHRGEYIVIDIDTGDYEIGTDYHALSRGILARKPDAALSVLRIGYPAAGRIGGRFTVPKP